MPQWFYGWNVLVFGLLFQAFSFGLVFYSFAIMLVPLQAAFAVSLSDIMLASVALQLGIGVYSGLLGKTLDICPPQYFVAAGGLCLAAGFATIALFPSYWIMLLVYSTVFPLGLILAGTLAAQSLAVRWFIQRRGLAIGLSALGTSIGGFLFPPLVSMLISGRGWQATFLLLALACLVVICPLALVLLRRKPPAPAVVASGSASAEDRLWTIAEVLRQRVFWLIILGFAPVTATFTAIQLNIGAYAKDQGIDVTEAAYLISLIAVAMMAGKLFFAAQADRIGHKALYVMISIGHMLVVLGLIAASQFHHIAAVSLLFGFSVGGTLPLAGAMVVDHFGGRSFGRVMGLVTPFVTMSSALGPLLAAFVRDASGSYSGAFTVFLYFLAPALLCVLLFLKGRSRIVPAGV